ncbi:MAG TPA: hypothetical protein DCZ13_09430, partial [Porticoccaceae bacterium]|nr:hypothetical protein [Porticoccaceae bacterium]
FAQLFVSQSQKACSLANLYKQQITRLGGKRATALLLKKKGIAATKAPLGIAHCLFGITKRRASRFAWCFFNHNKNNPFSVNRPWESMS